MTTRPFTRFVVAGALLATAALVLGAIPATAQTAEARCQPFMSNEIHSDCSEVSPYYTFDIIARVRLKLNPSPPTTTISAIGSSRSGRRSV